MSGIEVVGILLGAFPLIISAMEHYETEKRVVGTFWRIRKSHRKDVGKVKDCQLKFKLNLKELLKPLLLDEVVDHIEFERLLANPGGPGWKEGSVDEALATRLPESHERYLEILTEMEEVMGKLSKAVKVDDKQFQALLLDDDAPQNTPKQAAQQSLMIRANMSFQAKRVKYSFTGMQRDNLLDEVSKYNDTLEKLLAAEDRVSALSQNSQTTGRLTSSMNSKKVTSKFNEYWRHADRIFSLIKEAFQCQCRSMHCANLRLSHQPAGFVDMSVLLRFAHGTPVTGSPWDKHPMHIKLKGKIPSSGALKPLGQPKQTNHGPSILIHTAGSSTSTKTVNVVKSSSNTTATVQVSTATFQTIALPDDLKHLGLCKVVCSSTGKCLGSLVDYDNANTYTVLSTPKTLKSVGSITLAELLLDTHRPKLTRKERYALALTIASSHLQLHSTPWLKEAWTAEDIHLPLSKYQPIQVMHSEPYLSTPFEKDPQGPVIQKDRSFGTLGVVLLELCFGSRLETHPLWQQAEFSQGKTSPIIRQAVACEWLEDVVGEAGPDYASAVEWTMRSSPAPGSIKDEKWRSEFAASVVAPLQRCHESMM